MNNAKNTTLLPYLERLLDGEKVEWKTLGEICEKVCSGGTPSTATPQYYKGNIPWMRTQDIDWQEIHDTEIKITEEAIANSSAKLIPKNCVIVAMYGATAAKASINKIPLTTNQACCNLQIDENVAHYKYVYYWICNEYERLKALGEGSQSNLNAKKIKSYKLPIPPLRVQARIVEILDKFTQLEAELEKELEAELEARKKQYAYYRDQLLNFSQCPPLNVNIEWKTLGEVMDVVTDFTAAGSFASNAQNVRYLQEPNYALLVRTTDIKQGFKSTEKFIYVDQHAFEYLWRVNLDKECIILPNVGNCGEVYHSSPTILPYKNCVLGPNAILVRSEKASNKFLYYLFQAEYFQKELAKITSNIGQGKFNKTNLKQIKLPLPPLSEQRRIVDILDRFDTLTNSISEGLPKEIALRRKQYEYYRDALLSFPRAEVTV